MLSWFCDQAKQASVVDPKQKKFPYVISTKKVTIAFNIGTKNQSIMDRNITRFVQGKFVKRITELNDDLSIKNEAIVDLKVRNCSDDLLGKNHENFNMTLMYCADVDSFEIVGQQISKHQEGFGLMIDGCHVIVNDTKLAQEQCEKGEEIAEVLTQIYVNSVVITETFNPSLLT